MLASRDARKNDVMTVSDVMVTTTRLGDRNRGRGAGDTTVRGGCGTVIFFLFCLG